jgi:hypothetical protein
MSVQPAHEREKIIIRCDDIEDLLATGLASMTDHISLIFSIVDPDGCHESVTVTRTIPWELRIDME